MHRPLAWVTLGAVFLGGCATTTLRMPDHTLVLGEVAHIATREEIFQGLTLGPDAVPPPKSFVSQCGPEEDAIMDGSLILVRYYYYWQKEPSGIVHQGARWAVVPPELVIDVGNVVEVELLAGKTNANYRCSTISRIRFEDLKEGQCEYRQNPRTAFDTTQTTVNPAGGPGAAALYCPHTVAEGWEQFPMGTNRGSAWRKRPTTVE
jgi:hypothetical protein